MASRLSDYYRDFDEHSRLTGAFGELEFVRTMEVLARHLPPPPAVILDIGGGTGPYAEALGQKGYETHLLDAMEKHVKAAKARANVASARVGDARKLEWPDQLADAVLLMGPLYHLETAGDRKAALREARRVLKPGGLLAAAAISRFASLLDGLARGFLTDPLFRPILIQDLDTGEHRNTTGNIDFFTTAHFHLPEELAEEIRVSGFDDATVFAVEGVGWCARDLRGLWADREKREFLLDVLRRVERHPSIVGASPHLLACARAK